MEVNRLAVAAQLKRSTRFSIHDWRETSDILLELITQLPGERYGSLGLQSLPFQNHSSAVSSQPGRNRFGMDDRLEDEQSTSVFDLVRQTAGQRDLRKPDATQSECGSHEFTR